MKMKTTLKPSPLFTDGAVLCRGKEIRVFGEAPDGTTVRAELANRDGKRLGAGEVSARDGRFLLLLPPQPAQDGCRLSITAGDEAFAAEIREAAMAKAETAEKDAEAITKKRLMVQLFF